MNESLSAFHSFCSETFSRGKFGARWNSPLHCLKNELPHHERVPLKTLVHHNGRDACLIFPGGLEMGKIQRFPGVSRAVMTYLIPRERWDFLEGGVNQFSWLSVFGAFELVFLFEMEF